MTGVEAKMTPDVRERCADQSSNRKTCPIQTFLDVEANISVAIQLHRSDFSDTAAFSDLEF